MDIQTPQEYCDILLELEPLAVKGTVPGALNETERKRLDELTEAVVAYDELIWEDKRPPH